MPTFLKEIHSSLVLVCLCVKVSAYSTHKWFLKTPKGQKFPEKVTRQLNPIPFGIEFFPNSHQDKSKVDKGFRMILERETEVGEERSEDKRRDVACVVEIGSMCLLWLSCVRTCANNLRIFRTCIWFTYIYLFNVIDVYLILTCKFCKL